MDLYHSEFLANLTAQAINKKDRYKPHKHTQLKVGDIVLLTEKFTKRYHYPLGKVVKVTMNDLDEVTEAQVLKGTTREIVSRHSTSLILLLPTEDNVKYSEKCATHTNVEQIPEKSDKLCRSAAKRAQRKISSILRHE